MSHPFPHPPAGRSRPSFPRLTPKQHDRRRRRSESRPWFGFLRALILMVLLTGSARAQDAFFHRGAQHFLGGSNQLAKAEVERGLQQHPDDPHLKKFWELLNQQQQNQDKKDDEQKDQKEQKDPNKDQSDSQKQDQQKQDEQKKDSEQPKPPQNKPEQEKKPEDQQQSSGKKDQDKKDGENGTANKADKPEENQPPDGQPQSAAMIRMTPEQAIRLLDTLKSEERTLQFKPILRTNRTDRILKDW
jgi:Ca-activated chloride channel family protein